MSAHPLAGKPAPRNILVHVPRLVAAYYTLRLYVVRTFWTSQQWI